MLNGVHNFRDSGGYPAANGFVRRNTLYRSGRLSATTVEDEALLHDLRIDTIVDLRRGAERDAFPTGAWATSCQIITSDIGAHDDPWVSFLQAGKATAASIQDYILNFYRSVPFEDRYIDLFTRYFEALSDGEGPLLVHCSGGKDRTGIIIALTHSLLGVDERNILDDYLLTNRHWNYETHGPAVTQAMHKEGGRPVEPDAVRAAIAVDAAYLHAAFDSILSRSGTVGNYLESMAGVTPQRRDRIIARLVDVHGG